MALKAIIVVLYYFALAQAGVVETPYTHATPVYSINGPYNITPVFTKTVISPGTPVFETILTTHESQHKSSDGSEHASFTKTSNTAYSKIDKFESRSLPVFTIPSIHPHTSYSETTPFDEKESLIVTKTISPTVVYPNPVPVLTNPFYQAHSTYGVPLVEKNVSPDVTKTVSTPVVVAAPLLSKTVTPILKKSEIVSPIFTSHDTPDLKSFSPVITKSVTPIVYNAPSLTETVQTAPIRTAITYSEAPVVSHASFTGLGASYAW